MLVPALGSRAIGGRFQRADQQEGYIIVQMGVAEVTHISQQVSSQVGGRECDSGLRSPEKSDFAIFLAAQISRFGNAVGEEQQAVTGPEMHESVRIGAFREDAQDSAAFG